MQPQGPYQPQEQQNPGQASAPQWTQMPLPNQYDSQPLPGQAPPPVQLPLNSPQYAPQTPYPPQYAPQQPPPPQMSDGAAPPAQPHPQPSYQVPKTGLPRAKRRPKKGVYIALALMALGFAAFAVLRLLAPGKTAYGYVTSDPLSARYTGDAIVVRNETVYPQAGVSQIDYVADEGAQVQRGDIVATIYTSGFSAKEWKTLENYRTQIKEYQKSLISKAASDTKLNTLMTKVKERALEAQQLVQGAQGSLTNQESLLTAAMQDRQIYMKQKYPDDQKLTRLFDDENTQLQKISTWTKQYAAVVNGLVSFYTDGYETALNMSTYSSFSPAQVRAMYRGNVPQSEETYARNTVSIYRVVRQEPWAVLMLCNEMEWTPVTGRTYKLLIESFENTIVDATVDSFTRSGGELLVRLVIQDSSVLPEVLYIRSCQVQLGESVNTLKVPSRALYVRQGRIGVVMQTEGGEYWTGVEVVSDDGNSAYVIPENAGVLHEGQRIRLF